MPAAKPLLVAVESFVCEVDGHEVIVYAGVTRARADSPVVKGREQLFVPDKATADV